MRPPGRGLILSEKRRENRAESGRNGVAGDLAGPFFGGRFGEGREAEVPLETGEDAGFGVVEAHSAGLGGERV